MQARHPLYRAASYRRRRRRRAAFSIFGIHLCQHHRRKYNLAGIRSEVLSGSDLFK